MAKIGIIGAMDEEIEIYLSRMNDKKKTDKASRVFFEGTLSDTDVVLVKAGVGKVNCAGCAQILVDLFNVTHIIFTGCAGSLQNSIDIGDVVISRDCIQHDYDATALGYKPGEIMLMDKVAFEADFALVAAAEKACETVGVPYHVGRVLSGDTFVADKECKDRIKKLFGGLCAEMEGAAVAHTAFLNDIPYVVIRDISDKADEESHVDFNEFLKKASDTNASIICEMLKNI